MSATVDTEPINEVHETSEELLSQVRSAQFTSPTRDTKIFKDECALCFKSPFHPGGIYVCLKTYHAFCEKHARWHAEKQNSRLFLQIESKRINSTPDAENNTESGEPRDKISKLSISDPKIEINDVYNLVVYPSFEKCVITNDVGGTLFDACQQVINATSAERLQMLSTSSNAWDADIKLITKHANLEQLNNGKRLPYSGWVCEAEGCGLNENLWLNLTDGAIRCGRSQFIAEGKKTNGNGHMQEYYANTRYPLVVKLGTISSQLDAADVYSYDEDDAVIDPNLDKHLAHFGLDANCLAKTERSTMEMELDMNEKWEWAKCQEDGAALESIYGPGYTGIVNIGSSCYMNSVLQLLLQVPTFTSHFAKGASQIFNGVNLEQLPADFNSQVAKVFSSLTNGDFAVEGSDVNGIKPRQFKRVVAGNHREFSTAKQQDVEEYIRFFFEKVTENTHPGTSDPTFSFRFKTENRFQDVASGKVRYTDHEDVLLQLPISESLLVPIDDVLENRFRVSMISTIANTFSAQTVEGYKSPVTGEAKGATNTLRLKTFPDYLLVQVQKFAYSNNGQLKKLDIDFEVQDELDLSGLRSTGLSATEELLPEDAPTASGGQLPSYDRGIVDQLVAMGFTENASIKAAIESGQGGVEAAAEWVMMRLDDPTLNDAPVPKSTNTNAASQIDASKIESIVGLGFTEHQARYALQKNAAVEVATDWLFNNIDQVPPETSVTPASASKPVAHEFTDGEGKYKLVGFISHMGSRPDSGHYVAHMFKDGKWILFNDEKVAISQNPPKQLAYIYLYQRV